MAMLNDVPTITITLSTPAQKLLERESESESNPPEYTSSNNTQHEERDSTMTKPDDENHNDSSLAYPTLAYIPPSSTPTDLPTYDYATVDMPPVYQSPKTPHEAYFSNLPLEDPWPITKKLYFLGFIFWPLWFIGMGFSMFGRGDKTRLWGRRCGWNSLVIIALFIYLVVAYTRTGGRII